MIFSLILYYSIITIYKLNFTFFWILTFSRKYGLLKISKI